MLEVSRAELAEKQVIAQECSLKAEESRQRKKEKELQAQKLQVPYLRNVGISGIYIIIYLQVEQETIDAEIRSITYQYEALVKIPDPNSRNIDEILTSKVGKTSPVDNVDGYYTPDDSLTRGSQSRYTEICSGSRGPIGNVLSAAEEVSSGVLSTFHAEQLSAMQNEKDELENEIHALHVSYLSLQSNGDANEKILLESKV